MNRPAPLIPRQRSPPGAWRLLLPALAAWGFAACAVTTTGLAGPVLWIAAICGTAICAAAVCGTALGAGTVGLRVGAGRQRRPGAARRRFAGAALLLCAVLLLIGTRIALGEYARADPGFSAAAERGATIEFTAVLAGFPESRVSEFGERRWVRATADTGRGGVPVLLWLGDEPGTAPDAEWAPGTRVSVRGEPERFDAGGSAAYGVAVRRIDADPPADWSLAGAGAIASHLRLGLRDAAAGVPGAELVPGFAVGDTSLVPESLDRAMRESSLAHLVAVSGANCALVTGAVVWLLARLGAGRRLRTAAAGCGLAAFLVVVGPDASVQRAAVMAAALLAAGFGGRRAAALPALGLAILVLLLADPWQALQPGFALSVVATGGILLGATPLARVLQRRTRLPRVLALPVAVALAAQLACGPLLLLLQPGIPAVGVLANVLAASAAPLGTGLGLVVAVTAPWSPGLAHLATVVAALPARWVAATAEVAGALPLARWHWPEGWPGALLLAACEAALLLAWALRRGRLALPGGLVAPLRQPWHERPRAPRGVRVAAAVLLGTGLGLFVATTLAAPLAQRAADPAGWAVVACDVGQGDALLLRDPSRPSRVVLVDTGDDPEALGACLDRFGVDRVSLLVLSHDDRDHVGALGAVIDRVDEALIAPTVRGERDEDRPVVRSLRSAGVPYRIGAAGQSGSAADAGIDAEAGGLVWEVLAPAAGAEPADTNAASLVLRVDAGGVSVLLLADTGLDEQTALLRSGAELRSEVLKVAHHGSRDQDPELPGAVGAAWALVSVGAGNRYGHPADETLAGLAMVGTRTLRTDLQGSIALIPGDDGAIEAWVERSERSDVGGAP